MLDVQVKTTGSQTVAYVTRQGPYEQIPEAMGQLYAWVERHGLQPAGMPAGVYLDDPKTADATAARWEVRTPVVGDLPDTEEPGGLGIKHLEPHTVASVMYRGSYENISPTYSELGDWVVSHGYDVVGPAEELYYSDPATTKPDEYLTEIRFPVAPH